MARVQWRDRDGTAGPNHQNYVLVIKLILLRLVFRFFCSAPFLTNNPSIHSITSPEGSFNSPHSISALRCLEELRWRGIEAYAAILRYGRTGSISCSSRDRSGAHIICLKKENLKVRVYKSKSKRMSDGSSVNSQAILPTFTTHRNGSRRTEGEARIPATRHSIPHEDIVPSQQI